jgi:PKHD-type hydroxylase
MILCIADVLTSAELDIIRSVLDNAEFIDGKLTAGWHARSVKHNTQLSSKSEAAGTVRALVSQALQRNELFQMAARPKVVRPALVSRYEVGMSYGSHVDNALMGQPELMRSDLSFTLFLNDASDYEGGELVVETPQGEESFKLAAGGMVLYPSSTLHRVETVVKGMRLVAVSWVQSLVRDPQEREILFDLDTARRAIFQQYGKTAAFDLIAKSHANLLRKWADV